MSLQKNFKSVIAGVLLGPVLILAALPLLFWNEGRAVERAKSLDEGAAAVISVESDTIDPELEGNLIHISDTVETDAVLSDPLFPIETDGKIGLRRSVEMYQWHEEQRTRGSGDDRRTEYTYHKDWSRQEIDSSRFDRPRNHQNPSSMPYDQFEAKADTVTAGAFGLSSRFINQIQDYSPLTLEDDFDVKVADSISQPHEVQRRRLYIGNDSASPQIGDIRVSFSKIEPHLVSIIGAQTGSTISTYDTNAGSSLAILYEGQMSADEMFEAEHQANRILTWALRGGGTFAIFFGFLLLFGPISLVARFIPFVGPLIVAAKKLVAGGLTFVLAGVTISLGWVFYRPLIGIPLLLLTSLMGVALFALAIKVMSDKDDEELEAAVEGEAAV